MKKKIETVVTVAGEKAFAQAMKTLKNEIRSLNLELKVAEDRFKTNGNAQEYHKKASELVARKIEVQKKIIADTAKQLELAKTAYGENSSEALKYKEQLTKAELALSGLNRKLQEHEDALGKGHTALQRTGEKLEGYSEKLRQTSDRAVTTGRQLSQTTTKWVADIANAAKRAWEEIDGIEDTIVEMTGATGESAKSLQDSFAKVGGSVPLELRSVGVAIGELNTQFGFTGKTLEDSAELVGKFSSITKQDVSSAVRQAKGAMETFGLSADKLSVVLDTVAMEAQRTGVSTSELFSEITQGAPVLKSMGLSLEQSVNLLGSMKQSGVDSSAAMTGLQKANVIVAKSGGDLNTVLAEFSELAKSGASEQDKMTKASELFGTRGAVKMLDSAKRGALEVKNLANALGTVNRTFAETLDPADEATVALNNAKLAGAELWKEIQTAALPLLKSASKGIKSVTEWFKSLSDTQKRVIITVAGLVAAMGPLLVVYGQTVKVAQLLTSTAAKVAKGLSSLATSAPQIASSMGGVAASFSGATASGAGLIGMLGPIALGIGAVAAAGVALYAMSPDIHKGAKDYEKAVEGLGESVVKFGEGVANGRNLLEGFSDSAYFGADKIAQLEQGMKNAQDSITAICQKAVEERRALTEQDLDSMRSYMAEYSKLATERQMVYTAKSNIMLEDIQNEASMTITQAQDFAHTARAVYAEHLADIEKSHLEQRTKREAHLEQMRQAQAAGDAALAATHKQTAAEIERSADELRAQSLAKAEQNLATSIALTTQKLAEKAGVTQAHYDALALADEAYKAQMLEAEQTYNRLVEDDEVRAEAARASTQADAFSKRAAAQKQFLDAIGSDNAAALLAMTTDTIAAGGKLDVETGKIIFTIMDGLSRVAPDVRDKTLASFDGLIASMAEKSPQMARKMTETRDSINSAIKGMDKDGYTIGDQLMNGLGLGILKGRARAVASAADAVRSALFAMRNAAEVKSPSRATAYLGSMLTEGLVVGMEDKKQEAVKSAKLLARDVVGGFKPDKATIDASLNLNAKKGEPGIGASSSTVINVTVPEGAGVEFGRKVGEAVMLELKRQRYAKGAI